MMSIKITTNVLGLGAVAGFGAQSLFISIVHLKHKAPSLHITPPDAKPLLATVLLFILSKHTSLGKLVVVFHYLVSYYGIIQILFFGNI